MLQYLIFFQNSSGSKVGILKPRTRIYPGLLTLGYNLYMHIKQKETGYSKNMIITGKSIETLWGSVIHNNPPHPSLPTHMTSPTLCAETSWLLTCFFQDKEHLRFVKPLIFRPLFTPLIASGARTSIYISFIKSDIALGPYCEMCCLLRHAMLHLAFTLAHGKHRVDDTK